MANTEKSTNLEEQKEEQKVANNAKNDKLGAKSEEKEGDKKGLVKFYADNEKIINIVFLVILVIGLGIFALYKFYLTPKNEKASAALQTPIESVVQGGMMTTDSTALKTAIEGNDENDGFETIIDDYGITKASKYGAKHYAAICYLKMGKKDEALDLLLQCKKEDNYLWYEAQMLIGDIYDEKGDTDNAQKYYKKATEGDNDFVAPIALWKLGMLCERNNDFAGAYNFYKQIQDKHYERYADMSVDKYLERAKAKANK